MFYFTILFSVECNLAVSNLLFFTAYPHILLFVISPSHNASHPTLRSIISPSHNLLHVSCSYYSAGGTFGVNWQDTACAWQRYLPKHFCLFSVIITVWRLYTFSLFGQLAIVHTCIHFEPFWTTRMYLWVRGKENRLSKKGRIQSRSQYIITDGWQIDL